jgi:hypothetical protein
MNSPAVNPAISATRSSPLVAALARRTAQDALNERLEQGPSDLPNDVLDLNVLLAQPTVDRHVIHLQTTLTSSPLHLIQDRKIPSFTHISL